MCLASLCLLMNILSHSEQENVLGDKWAVDLCLSKSHFSENLSSLSLHVKVGKVSE